MLMASDFSTAAALKPSGTNPTRVHKIGKENSEGPNAEMNLKQTRISENPAANESGAGRIGCIFGHLRKDPRVRCHFDVIQFGKSFVDRMIAAGHVSKSAATDFKTIADEAFANKRGDYVKMCGDLKVISVSACDNDMWNEIRLIVSIDDFGSQFADRMIASGVVPKIAQDDFRNLADQAFTNQRTKLVEYRSQPNEISPRATAFEVARSFDGFIWNNIYENRSSSQYSDEILKAHNSFSHCFKPLQGYGNEFANRMIILLKISDKSKQEFLRSAVFQVFEKSFAELYRTVSTEIAVADKIESASDLRLLDSSVWNALWVHDTRLQTWFREWADLETNIRN